MIQKYDTNVNTSFDADALHSQQIDYGTSISYIDVSGDELFNSIIEELPAQHDKEPKEKVGRIYIDLEGKAHDISPYFFKQYPHYQELIDLLDNMPSSFQLIPVGKSDDPKAPAFKGWKEEFIGRDEIKNQLKGVSLTSKKGNPYKKYSSGVGVLSGDPSNGLLLIDCDGQGAIDKFNEIVGSQNSITMAWTSGKKGRIQIAYRIPDEFREIFHKITNVKIKEKDKDNGWELDFRYNKCQSVLPPSYHPETGHYKWLIKGSPSIAPKPIIEQVLKLNAAKISEKILNSKPIPCRLDIEKTSTSSLIDWYLANIKKENPRDIFNNPAHQWNGSKGYSLEYDEYPEISCSIYQKNNGEWVINDFANDKIISPIDYEYCVNIASCPIRKVKGSKWISGLKSLASRFNWDNLPESYDKDAYLALIEKTQKTLQQIDKSKYVEILSEGKYLDGEKIEKYFDVNKPSVFYSNAKMGDGKTTLLKRLCGVDKQLKITSIVPTIGLGMEGCREDSLRLQMRNDLVVGEYTKQLLENEERLGICYPSLHHIEDRKGDVLILDEVYGGLEFLFNASNIFSTSIKKCRAACIKALIKLIQNHKVIICFDAFLNQVVCDFIDEIAESKEKFFLSKEVQQSDRDVFLVSEDKWESKLSEMISHGKKIVITCDSKLKVQAIEKKLVDRGIEVIAVHGDNSGNKEYEELLKNPTKFLKETPHQVFMYSPVFGSGKDIDIHGVYDAVFASNCHLMAQDFCQQCGRPRDKKTPLYYHVSGNGGYKDDLSKSCLPGEQKKHLKAKASLTVEHEMIQIEKQKLIESLNIEDSAAGIIAYTNLIDSDQSEFILNTTASLRAIGQYNQENRQEKIHYFLRSQGYSIKAILGEDATDENIRKIQELGYEVVIDGVIDGSEKKLTKVCKESIKQIISSQVAKAELITNEEYELLKSKKTLTDEERPKYKRYQLEKLIPKISSFAAEINTDESEFMSQAYKALVLDDSCDWIKGVKNYQRLIEYQKQGEIESFSINNAIQAWKETGYITPQDLKMKSPAYTFLVEELKIFEILDFKGETLYSNIEAGAICEKICKLKKNKDLLKVYFNIKPYKIGVSRSPIQWLNGLLEKFALTLEKTTRKGGVTRYYRIAGKQCPIEDFEQGDKLREFIEKSEINKINNNQDTQDIEIKEEVEITIIESNHTPAEKYNEKELEKWEELIKINEDNLEAIWHKANYTQKEDILDVIHTKLNHLIPNLLKITKCQNRNQISSKIMDEFLLIA